MLRPGVDAFIQEIGGVRTVMDSLPLSPSDFRALFEAAPGLYLALLPDAPKFTIVAVSDAYLQATLTRRQEILGRGLFDVFPDDPKDATATGVENLRTSLLNVIWNRVPHMMAVQKYAIRRPEEAGGGFEERYWTPINSPVFGRNGQVNYLLHRVEDVTAFVQQERQQQHDRQEAQQRLERTERQAAYNLLRAEGLQETNSQLLRLITERREAEEEIRVLNTRLQRAMTETHHRVKNSLQVVSALIDLYLHSGRSVVPLEEMARLSRNVRAMGAIHEILTLQSQSESGAERLFARALLEQLTSLLDPLLQGRNARVISDEVWVSSHQASALALLTNELLFNAVKHGAGEITLHLRQEGEIVSLEAWDEGPGFPPDFDPTTAAQSGLELIENIVHFDLQGQTAYRNRESGGAMVVITFPL